MLEVFNLLFRFEVEKMYKMKSIKKEINLNFALISGRVEMD